MDLKKFILISNRGPSFSLENIIHKGYGGTQDAYIYLMSKFSLKWFFLLSEQYVGNINSEYGNILNPIYIDNKLYDQYYYKYISEYLYPTMLGFGNGLINNYEFAYDYVINKIYDTIKCLKDPILICDYHLYKLPFLLQDKYTIFFLFIPFLDLKYQTDKFKEIVFCLSKANKIVFLNEIYKDNFIQSFKSYFPTEILKTECIVATLGPNECFNSEEFIPKDNYISFLKTKFGYEYTMKDKVILSVSRMDIVKNIPVLIKGFSRFLERYNHYNCKLLIIAQPHRNHSLLYKSEESIIDKLIKNSKYKSNIYFNKTPFSKDELFILYRYSNIFICSSNFDGMPLTPLEFSLSNKNNGALVLSEFTGANKLLEPYGFSFKQNDYEDLAEVLNNVFMESTSSLENRSQTIKDIILKYTLNKWGDNITNFIKGL